MFFGGTIWVFRRWRGLEGESDPSAEGIVTLLPPPAFTAHNVPQGMVLVAKWSWWCYRWRNGPGGITGGEMVLGNVLVGKTIRSDVCTWRSGPGGVTGGEMVQGVCFRWQTGPG